MSQATDKPAGHGLGSLVEGYMRRKLRHDIHPTLRVLRDTNNESAVESQVTRSQSSFCGEDTAPMKQIQGTQSPDDKDENSLGDLCCDVMLEKDRFQEAMEAYEQITAGSTFNTYITSKSLHTWEEMLEEVNRAAETYHSREALRGKIRAGLRRLGDNSKVFEAWAALLPSGSDCATVISGGLKLILAAAARLSDLRQEISDALAEIPSLLTCIHQALNIFKGSKDLLCQPPQSSGIVKQLTTPEKLGLSILRQGSLRAESERFDRAARLCSYGAIEETRVISIKNEQTLNGYVDQSGVNHQTQLRSDQANTRDEIHAIQHRVSDLFAIMERFPGSHDAVDPKTLEEPPLCTIQTPSLHAWITTPTSSALFINLNTPAISPLHSSSSSFLAAKLIQSINAQPSENIITPAFFCGAHTRHTDPNSGPQGTMRSLVAQLLQSHPRFDIETVCRVAQLHRDDVHGLYEIFHELVRQLPADVVVFCVADGVTEFEERIGTRESGEEVVRALVRIVEDCIERKPGSGRCVFKLLLTSPKNSRRLWKFIPGELGDVVWMPDVLPSLGGFTSYDPPPTNSDAHGRHLFPVRAHEVTVGFLCSGTGIPRK
ncbi:hypothetical protein BDW66DRAFT_169088 [Aspergillus desertorum]